MPFEIKTLIALLLLILATFFGLVDIPFTVYVTFVLAFCVCIAMSDTLRRDNLKYHAIVVELIGFFLFYLLFVIMSHL